MAACAKAVEIIDMRRHSGVHPRIGAVDVVPFIPLMGSKMQDAVSVAHRFGRKFGEKCGVPVYFYGEAALNPARRELSDIRCGGYEKLTEKLSDPHWLPDAGPALFNERTGAAVVGARMPLVAFNVNLHTNDLGLAKNIAKSIRQSGGGLRYVKAIGVPLKSRNIVQVSMNLANYRETSLRTAFDAVKEMALQCGVAIVESELIGLIPEEALAGVSADDLQLTNFCADCIIETHLREPTPDA
jgi:glutamate formiminotransferase